MPVLHDRMPPIPSEKCRAGLDFVYGLLTGPSSDSLTLDRLLAWLARAFGSASAGLAGPVGSQAPAVHRIQENGQPLPPILWTGDGDLDPWALTRTSATAVSLSHPEMGSCLLTNVQMPDGSHWLLWLEETPGHVWDAGEAATFSLAGLALARWAAAEAGRSPGARQLVRPGQQRFLDDAARVARRLAHDYGNILTGILGFSELAFREAPAPSSLHRYLKEVNRAAQRGADLTHLLRLFGCRRATQLSLVPLRGVAVQETERMRPSLRPDIVLNMSVAADLPPIAISEELLRLLLVQLLENAREALSGPGTIALTAQRTELKPADTATLLGSPSPGPFVEVSVSDTGCGLRADIQRRLFTEPFFSTKPRHRGLGLAVVYGILHAHGGGFRLEAIPAGGTRARLYLPIAQVAAIPPVAVSGPCCGEHVLVVDDEPTVLQMVGATLRMAGYRVVMVDCPIKALDSYATMGEPFHLVLSDVRMPNMNGFDLARRLRSRDADANVLFMSGQADAELAETQSVLGPQDLLCKPFQTEALLRAVRAALDRDRHRAAACADGPADNPTRHLPRSAT